MIALGIDPGTAITGYGVVKEDNGNFYHIASGIITTSKDLTDEKRLSLLYDQVNNLFTEHSPEVVAVEKLFFFKNLKTALPVSQARGVVLLAVEKANLPLYEFTPLEVKQSVTGYGKADKNQVQEMIKMILSLKEKPHPDDVADALGVAVCGLLSKRSLF